MRSLRNDLPVPVYLSFELPCNYASGTKEGTRGVLPPIGIGTDAGERSKTSLSPFPVYPTTARISRVSFTEVLRLNLAPERTSASIPFLMTCTFLSGQGLTTGQSRPFSLRIVTPEITPSLSSAETRNAPTARSVPNLASISLGQQGKSRSTPSWLWRSISLMARNPLQFSMPPPPYWSSRLGADCLSHSWRRPLRMRFGS